MWKKTCFPISRLEVVFEKRELIRFPAHTEIYRTTSFLKAVLFTVGPPYRIHIVHLERFVPFSAVIPLRIPIYSSVLSKPLNQRSSQLPR